MAYWGYAASITTLIVAILGPTLGALADTKNFKKKIFSLFVIVGILGCALLGVVSSWLAFLAIFVIAKVGFSGSLVFYDAMLVGVVSQLTGDINKGVGVIAVMFAIGIVCFLIADKTTA